jgi:hypothetical protein
MRRGHDLKFLSEGERTRREIWSLFLIFRFANFLIRRIFLAKLPGTTVEPLELSIQCLVRPLDR